MKNLIPLRIPHPWLISYNSFTDDEMIIENGEILNYNSFKEDVLVIEECAPSVNGEMAIKADGYFIDLGWFPDSDPNGEYKLLLMKGSRSNIVLRHSSKSKTEIASLIERCLLAITEGECDWENF